MSTLCYCTICKHNNPLGGSLVSYGTRRQHEMNDQNANNIAAIKNDDVESFLNEADELTEESDDDVATHEDDHQEQHHTYENNGHDVEDDEGGDSFSVDDEDEGPFFDNSAFPSEPVAFLMFLMVVLLYSKSFCTNEGLELIMLFLNQVLLMTNHHYRFPVRVHTLEKWAQLSERVYSGITSYVCCTKCRSMYPIQSNRIRNKKCTWRDTVGNALTCANNLYSEKNGIYTPVQLFHYNSIQQTIQTFLQRPHFVDQLTNRRQKYLGYCSDIQDAQAFNTFKMGPRDAMPFTEESPYNILLSIFVDWFQLFDNNSQDVGGMYASIQNLLPSERHLVHNTLTLGIMNGPNETSYLHINHYLDLIVNELQILKDGVIMRNCYDEDVLVKVAVNHYQADLPAMRKMLGLIGHNADRGCSNCENPFPKAKVIRKGQEKEVNVYSNTDTSQWVPRTLAKHKQAVELYLTQSNKTSRDEVKKLHGALYSSFLELPYFNPISDGGIDIMHLLLNGIASRIIRNIWLGIDSTIDDHLPLLENADLMKMSNSYDKLIIPLGYENNTTRKIAMGSGFSNLKSSEWLIFVLVSPLVLHGTVIGRPYLNWLKFVEICSIVCSTCITDADIATVRGLCFEFLDDFKAVYPDPRYMSINFHMLLHLADQNLMSFGSGPSTWNFAYEARNKAIKGINTNAKSNLELTLMKRQLISAHLEDYASTLPLNVLASHFAASSDDVLSCIRNKDNDNAAQMPTSIQDEYLLSSDNFDFELFLSERRTFMLRGFEHLPPSAVKSLHLKKNSSLSPDDFLLLLEYYSSAYRNATYILGVGAECSIQGLADEGYLQAENKVKKFVSLALFHCKYKSCESNVKHHRGSHVLAFDRSRMCLAPAQVQYFFRHLAPVYNAQMQVQMVNHTLAVVKWYKPASNPLSSFEKAAKFIDLCSADFEQKSAFSVIPVLNIHSPIAIVPDYIDNMNAFVKMPEQLIF